MAALWRLSPAGFRGDLDPAAWDLDQAAFHVARFEQLPSRHPGELLGLSVRMPLELPRRARPALVVTRDSVELLYSPRLASSARLPASDGRDWLWRGIVRVPPELSADPGSLFALRLHDDLRVALPLPHGVPGLQEPVRARRGGGAWPYAIRRGVLLLVVTCQLCTVPALWSSGALAAETPGAVMTVEPAGEAPSISPVATPTAPAPEQQPVQPTGATPETPPASPAAGPAEPTPGQASQPAAHTQRESTKTGPEANVVKLSVSEAPSTPAGGIANPWVRRHQGRPAWIARGHAGSEAGTP